MATGTSSGSADSVKHSYLAPDQLRVGVFVILDLPWFKHPFTLSSFKIKNEEQVRDLRGLRLERYRFDPERSDALPDGAAVVEAPPPAPVPAASNADEPAVTDPAQVAKQQRVRALKQRRENVEQVEKAFAKATAVMKNLNRNIFSRPKETLEEMGALIGQMVDAFLQSPEATLHVMGEKAGGEDAYFHSLNITILAMMLAKELGFTPETAREMGVGSMLHDIGLTEIPDRIAKKNPDEFTNAERLLRATHVDQGVGMGQRIGLSPGAIAIVAQHHELADGTGYPKGLKEAAMTPAARLISLVNFYDNLCNPADINKAMTPHEALSFMFSQRRAKFEARAMQLMIRSLGVYPPGSIVQLSNQTLAVVTSINPKKPLRPWVLLYDPKIPKEEALTLNLELEPEINIAKSIRPALLPPKVAAYLNPRKRITYFFDAGSGTPDAAGGG